MMGDRTSLYVCLLYLFSDIYSCATGTCPSGWYGGEGDQVSCYKVSREQKDYKEHYLSCRQQGGHLASIHSEDELNAIKSLIQHDSGNFFIGLTTILTEGTWKYSDSTPFDFNNWENGEPNNYGNEDCVEMKTSGLWNVVPCSIRLGGVCQLGTCAPFQFACDNGTCIPRNWTCDGIQHCTEGEDEFCHNKTCEPFQFVCYDGTCIQLSWFCDGYRDCTEGEDEICLNKTCEPFQFVCDNGSCISQFFVCDGYHDCPGGEDEFCHNSICPPGWEEGSFDPGVCYKVAVDTQTYEEHETSCRSIGGHLASIHSLYELNDIRFSLWWFGIGPYFIGLTDKLTEGKWKYSDSTPFDFHYWENGTPNNLDNGDDCVAMNTYNGVWNDVSCSSRLMAVCKRERVDTTAKNEFLAEYVDYKGRAVTTDKNEFLTEYVAMEYNERAVTTDKNEFLPEYVATEYNAVSSTEKEFSTEYLITDHNGADQNCPTEWIQFGSFCFLVDTTKGMFRDAKSACQARGGELASIHSKEEQSFVYSILRDDVQSYFIGLTFDTQTRTWNYTDNSALDFTNWYPNMPDGGEVENCVEIYFYHDGKWNDVSCFSPFNGAVCKATLGSSLLSGPLNNPESIMTECGNGWLNYYNENLYCFMATFLQWNEAARKCADYGGHLVSIQNKYENDFLEEAMENLSIEFVWIGMSDLHEEGVWRWESSHDIPSYTNWDYLEPNNLHNEDCAVMYLDWNFRLRKGAWYDSACCHEFPSICQKQF